MSDNQNQPAQADTIQSGKQLVTVHEDLLILESQILPHGVGVNAFQTATLEGYDTVKGQDSPSARPDWSSEYSLSMKTLKEAANNQPPEVLHAADYVLERVAKMTDYNEQRIIEARLQLAQDLKDGSFASKVENVRNAIETMVNELKQPLER